MIGKGGGRAIKQKHGKPPKKGGLAKDYLAHSGWFCPWCHYAIFFLWFLRQIVFCMLSTSCFFHVASSLLHFGSRFFFDAAVFRSRFLLVHVRASVLGLFPLC